VYDLPQEILLFDEKTFLPDECCGFSKYHAEIFYFTSIGLDFVLKFKWNDIFSDLTVIIDLSIIIITYYLDYSTNIYYETCFSYYYKF
jgi:hypothetical protein